MLAPPFGGELTSDAPLLKTDLLVDNLGKSNISLSSDLEIMSIPSSSLTSPTNNFLHPSISPNSNPIPCSPSTRALGSVKRGFRALPVPRICGVTFEGPPAWLWSLRMNDWSSILIPPNDANLLRRDYETTWTVFQPKLVIADLPLLALLAGTASVWLASGSSTFLSNLSSTAIVDPLVRIVLGEGRRPTPILKAAHIQWVSLPHTRVGGVYQSLYRGLFGSSPPEVCPGFEAYHRTRPQTLHPPNSMLSVGH